MKISEFARAIFTIKDLTKTDNRQFTFSFALLDDRIELVVEAECGCHAITALTYTMVDEGGAKDFVDKTMNTIAKMKQDIASVHAETPHDIAAVASTKTTRH